MKKMAFLLMFALLLAGCKEEPKKEPDPDLLVTAKPAIYIYPEEVCDEKPVLYLSPTAEPTSGRSAFSAERVPAQGKIFSPSAPAS